MPIHMSCDLGGIKGENYAICPHSLCQFFKADLYTLKILKRIPVLQQGCWVNP